MFGTLGLSFVRSLLERIVKRSSKQTREVFVHPRVSFHESEQPAAALAQVMIVTECKNQEEAERPIMECANRPQAEATRLQKYDADLFLKSTLFTYRPRSCPELAFERMPVVQVDWHLA